MKRKIGELYGKSIVEGEENELTINEIKVTKSGEKKIILYARNGNKVENITSGSIQEEVSNYNPDFMRAVTSDDVIKQYNVSSKQSEDKEILVRLFIVSGQGIYDYLDGMAQGQKAREIAYRLKDLGKSITFPYGAEIAMACGGYRDYYTVPKLLLYSLRTRNYLNIIASQDNEKFAKSSITMELEDTILEEVPYKGDLDFYINVAPIYPQDFEAYYNSLDQNSLT